MSASDVRLPPRQHCLLLAGHANKGVVVVLLALPTPSRPPDVCDWLP